MKDPLVLTFDIGTQSARCLLARQDGTFADFAQEKYGEPYFSKEPGWAEQTPNFYFDKIVKLGRQICEKNAALLPQIIAVTVTVIRDTVLCLDAQNRPLRNIILWLDKRQADFKHPFPLWKSAIFHLAGVHELVKSLYRATAANWIRQHEPDIWEKTAKYVMLPTYLNYKLTGVLADCEANMIGHIPFDYKSRKWKSKWDISRCVTDVETEKLITPVKSGEIIGRITGDFSALTGIPEGLPLIATGSDKGCETLGLSVIKENRAAISFGTTATIQMSVADYFEPQTHLPAYPAVLNNLYNPEIEIYRGFWLLSWFIREFGLKETMEARLLNCTPEQVMEKYIEKIPPGCDGLLLQPFWTPGVKNPSSKGSILGFSDRHTHYHLYRAIIEGITFELYQSLTVMEKRSGKKIDELFVAGGGAGSNIVCQITADVFGVPVKRIQTHEASSIGASMVAFVALGVFPGYDEAIAAMVHIKDFFLPRKKEHRLYRELYNTAYKKIFNKLEPLYKKISR